MRIALVSPYAWDAPGGVQVHVRQLGEYLRGAGHEVATLAPALGRVSDPVVTIVGRALRIPYQGTVAPICFSPGSFARVGRALRSFCPDVVHVHEPLSPSTSMFATLRTKAPVVATFHAFAERSALLDVAVPILRPIWRRLAARIAVSETAAGFVHSRFGGAIEVIPNALNLQPFTSATMVPRADGRRMLWVGRLDRQKGFPVAVGAFRTLAAEFPDLRFLVIGDGRDRGAVEGLPGDVRSRVTMLGTVPHDELPGHLAGGDVVVAPALGQESFGYVLVEAMAAGVPVVAARIPGYDEVVRDGTDGLLVHPGDADSLADAVRRILCEPELAGDLRTAGRERAGEFGWDRIGPRLEAVYQRVTA